MDNVINSTGYNCELVEGLRYAINATARNAGRDIADILHDQIVVPMSTVWYAPEAKTFFEKFAVIVAGVGSDITTYFDNYRATVQSAGEYWAENTGGQKPVLPAIDLVEITLNYSDIADNYMGNVIINEAEAKKIASNLSDVESNIKAKLESLAGCLNANGAFLGHGQAEAVNDCFVKVSGSVSKIFNFLYGSGPEDPESLAGQIELCVKKYVSASTEVSNAFKAPNNNETTTTPKSMG